MPLRYRLRKRSRYRLVLQPRLHRLFGALDGAIGMQHQHLCFIGAEIAVDFTFPATHDDRLGRLGSSRRMAEGYIGVAQSRFRR